MALVGLAAAWTLGCWLALGLDPMAGLAPPLVGLALLAALAWPLAPNTLAARAGLLLAALLLGAARVAAALPGYAADPLAGLDGPVVLRGRVAEPPIERAGSTTFVLEVEEVQVGAWTGPAAAPVQVRVGPLARLQYGDLLELRGDLEPPRSTPGYPLAEVLARRGIRHVLELPEVRLVERSGGPEPLATLHRLRVGLSDALRRALPEPHASLLGGLLLGTVAGLPRELRAALAATGTGHLVAVSGFNVALIAGVLGRLLGRWPGRPYDAPLALLALAAYTLLVGAPPSAVRAAIMGGLAVVAAQVGRLSDPLTALGLAAALMVGVEPRLLGDLGFQLSFLATAGLVLLQPGVSQRLVLLPAAVREPLSVTLAAQIATLPLTLHVFRQVSLVAPLTNLVVAPAVPLVMAVGLLPLPLAGWPALAGLAAWPAWVGLEFMLRAIELSAALPAAATALGAFGPELVALSYLLLGAVACAALPEGRVLLARLAPLGARLGPLVQTAAGRVALGAGALLLLLGGFAWAGRPDGQLHVVRLDLPGGSAVFVRSPGGRTVLVTDGRGGPALAAAASAHLRPWERSFDALALTDPAGRSGPGLADLARRYELRLALLPPEPADRSDPQAGPPAGGAGRALPDGLLAAWGAPERHPAAPALRVELDDGAWLEVLEVAGTLDLLVGYGQVGVLLAAPGSRAAGWTGELPARRVLWLAAGAPHPDLVARAGPELVLVGREEVREVVSDGFAIELR